MLLCEMYKIFIFMLCVIIFLSAAIGEQLGSRKIEAVAFVLHNSQSAIHISGKDEAVCFVFVAN